MGPLIQNGISLGKGHDPYTGSQRLPGTIGFFGVFLGPPMQKLGFLRKIWDLPHKMAHHSTTLPNAKTKWSSFTHPAFISHSNPPFLNHTHSSSPPPIPVRLSKTPGSCSPVTGEQDPGVFVHGLYYCVLYWAKHSGLNLVFTNDSWHPPNLSTSLHSMSGLKCTRSPMVSSES